MKNTDFSIANSGAFVTHTVKGTSPTSDFSTWNMKWKSPVLDKETITFYTAMNGANGNDRDDEVLYYPQKPNPIH